jgi:hypothetical protein
MNFHTTVGPRARIMSDVLRNVGSGDYAPDGVLHHWHYYVDLPRKP